MKRIFTSLLLIALIVLVFQIPVRAIDVDYSFSVNNPIYKNGENVFKEDVSTDMGLGFTFQKSFGMVRLSGDLSNHPLFEDTSENMADYLSLSANINLFRGGNLSSTLTSKDLSLSYMTKLSDRISSSVGNNWNFKKGDTSQQIGLNYKNEIGDGAFVDIGTSWNFNNFKETENASITFNYKRNFHFINGKVINTSVRVDTFRDKNGNKQRDQGEGAISDITIVLLQNEKIVKKVITSEGGTVSFGEVDPGTYKVELVISSLPERHEITTSKTKKIKVKKDEISQVKFGIRKRTIEEKTTFSGSLNEEDLKETKKEETDEDSKTEPKEKRVKELENKIESLKEEKEEIKKENEELKKETEEEDQLQREIKEVKDSKEATKQENKELKERLEKKEEKIKELEIKIETVIVEREKIIEKLKKENRGKEDKIETLKTEKDKETEQLEIIIKRKDEEINVKDEKVDNLEEQVESLIEQNNELKEALEKAEKKGKVTEEKVKKLESREKLEIKTVEIKKEDKTLWGIWKNAFNSTPTWGQIIRTAERNELRYKVKNGTLIVIMQSGQKIELVK